jgi:large subunit ribosomal protein L27e
LSHYLLPCCPLLCISFAACYRPSDFQVTKRTSAKVQARRSSVKTFTKVVNYNHIMPTRYTLDIDLKGVVTAEALENSSKRTDANKVRR